MKRQNPFKAFLLIAVFLVGRTALSVAAQEPPPKDAKPKPEKEAVLSDEEKETRLAAEQVVGGIELEIFNDDKWTKVKRIEKPLLFFSDATRKEVDPVIPGSLAADIEQVVVVFSPVLLEERRQI